jgi:hypothetical protein
MPASDQRVEIADPLLPSPIDRIITAPRSTHVPAELVMRAPHMLAYPLRLYQCIESFYGVG